MAESQEMFELWGRQLLILRQLRNIHSVYPFGTLPRDQRLNLANFSFICVIGQRDMAGLNWKIFFRWVLPVFTLIHIWFQLNSAKSQSKTDWKYEQVNVKVDRDYKANMAPHYKQMYFILWSKRGSSYQSDVAIDDFMVREGECQVGTIPWSTCIVLV